ncbi:MAG: type II toxin-antitoxin system VapB family antitoxin [Geodermatophilaceae bacterium]|nr:type II toxin-antitoxin system VapB family antitoxin [Geodermatophilaceae bacterium]
MRTTVTIDDQLLAEVKQIAARNHRTIGSVLEDALRRMLAEIDSPKVGADFSLPAHGAGGLRSGVDIEDRDGLAELLGDNDPALARRASA